MRDSKQNFKILTGLIKALWAIFLNIFRKISSVWNQETSDSDLVVPDPPDRISELPDEIIYLILRKLRPHRLAARTSILSRRWLKLWNSYPVVEFDCKQTTKFCSFATATSKRLNKTAPLLLESFSVSLDHPDNLGQGLDELMSSAYGDGSPLRVVVQFRDKNIPSSERPSPLVEGRMLLNCSRTKFLYLRGCDLSQVHNLRICLDNLQELCLIGVRVSEGSFFTNCLANAPRLKKLSLYWIEGINFLKLDISGLPLLQTLCFHSLDHINLLNVAPSVKFLEIATRCQLRRSEIEDLISKLPSLVSLRVNISLAFGIFGDDRLSISAHKLRKLTVTQFSPRVQVEIDAPNLVTLTIDTHQIPTNYNFVNVPYACRCVVICNMDRVTLTTDWFTELRNCLTTLAARFHHLVFKLKFSYLDEVPTFDLSRMGNESSPLVVQHLQFATDIVSGAVEGEKQAHQTLIVNGLFSTCHPKRVSVAQLPKNLEDRRIFSYLFDQIERSKNLLSCCSNGGCWRHRFKNAKITQVTKENTLKIDKPSVNTIFLFCDFSDLKIPHPPPNCVVS
ncbi:hypothetical protein LINGRAHAP2_LOCUS3411 [Linum grandiflorum]